MKMRSWSRALFWAFSGLMAVCIALAAPVARATDAIIATPTVGAGPVFLAITPDGKYVYTANEVDGTVSVIDTATNEVVATVPLGSDSYPMSVAITPNGKYAYVADYNDMVSVIDTATNTVVATVPLASGAGPEFVEIAPDGRYAYVADNGNNTVVVIDTATNTVAATVSSGGNEPVDIAITPDGKYVYVANEDLYSGLGTSTVGVIDATANTFLTTIPVGWNPAFIAITPNGKYAYVSDYDNSGPGTSQISVIDTATNTVVTTISVSPGTNPDDIAFTPDGKYAYVADYNGMVNVIDTATNTIITTIEGLGGSTSTLSWVMITPDGQYAYVPSNFNNVVYVIATEENANPAIRNTLVQTISLLPSIHPISETMTPNGRCVYVGTGNGTGFVSPIPGTVTVIARDVTGATGGSCASPLQISSGSAATPIPALGDFALGLLALLLAGAAFAGLRHGRG